MIKRERDDKILKQLRQLERRIERLGNELPEAVRRIVSKEFSNITSTASQDPAQMLDTARALIVSLKHRCEIAEERVLKAGKAKR
jgi:hypothetical protein